MPRILVIDDDELVRQLVSETLGAAGHEVRSAPDGRAGLRLLGAEDFDLVVTDVVMPEADGLETIQEALRLRPGLKIIAMSGGGNWLPPDKCLAVSRMLGAARALAKPVSPESLISVVGEVLEE